MLLLPRHTPDAGKTQSMSLHPRHLCRRKRQACPQAACTSAAQPGIRALGCTIGNTVTDRECCSVGCTTSSAGCSDCCVHSTCFSVRDTHRSQARVKVCRCIPGTSGSGTRQQPPARHPARQCHLQCDAGTMATTASLSDKHGCNPEAPPCCHALGCNLTKRCTVMQPNARLATRSPLP